MRKTVNKTSRRQDGGLTEIVFILDASGSMSGLEPDVIGGFNAMISQQKQLDGRAYVSAVTFNIGSRVLLDRCDLQAVRPLTAADYQVGGCTALLDALGDAIRHIGNIHKYARPEDVPDHTIFMITTDGMENASHRYTAAQIRQLVDRQQRRYGWQFRYAAANIDAIATGRDIGLDASDTMAYVNTPKGIGSLCRSLNDSISELRNGSRNN